MRSPDRADAYGRHTGRYSSELAPQLLRFAGVATGMRVLDVGCGPGALSKAAAGLVGPDRVAAIDPSPEFLEACRARVPEADLQVGCAESLPCADEAFDAVLAQLVVQALEDPVEAAAEMIRVTRPGGVSATCVWEFGGGMPLLDAYWSAALATDPEGARLAGAGERDPWCTRDGLERLWRGVGALKVELGSLSAGAGYESLDDAWWSFAAGVGVSGAYCRSLDEAQRAALREEFDRRLDPGDRPFRLVARAWAVRGRAP
jgi:SAM-dependent methyltransferase